MLNLFQHLLFRCINLEIPKQVRNDRKPSPIVIANLLLSVIASRRRSNLGVVVIGNAMVGGVIRGVQRDFPLAGVWGHHLAQRGHHPA